MAVEEQGDKAVCRVLEPDTMGRLEVDERDPMSCFWPGSNIVPAVSS